MSVGELLKALLLKGFIVQHQSKIPAQPGGHTTTAIGFNESCVKRCELQKVAQRKHWGNESAWYKCCFSSTFMALIWSQESKSTPHPMHFTSLTRYCCFTLCLFFLFPCRQGRASGDNDSWHDVSHTGPRLMHKKYCMSTTTPQHVYGARWEKQERGHSDFRC